jgi:arsenite-transporting ATPase
LIEVLAQQARETAALLTDPDRASFQWVTLPEELSLAESEDGIGALADAGIRVEGVVVNRTTPDGPPCSICDRRRFAEQRAIAGVTRRIGRGRTVRLAAAVRPEPRGVAALAAIGARLADQGGAAAAATKFAPRATRRASGRLPRDMAMSLPRGARTVSPESLDVLDGARLLFFGGKGGVGKTTTAAAVALKLARVRPERAVLLLSTDPAHSLGDVFAEAIGDEPTPVSGGPRNLMVREVDAAAALAARRAALEAALGEMGEAFGASGVTLATGGRGAAELMDLAPPGIDELFGFLSVVEARDHFPLIVLDTAPTGHALRLLEMPQAAHEWVQVLLRVLLKYRSIVRPGQLAAELVEVSKSIRALQTLLHNARDTRFVVVTRAAAVPRSETGRLLRSLARLRLATPAVVVNAVTLAPGRCPNCRATAATERREMAELRRQRLCAGCVIIQTPLAAPPPRGLAALDRWAESWLADGPPGKPRRPPA